MKPKLFIPSILTLVSIVLSLMLSNAQPVSAGTLHVCSSCTYTTLQAAVDAAAAGDVIEIAGGTYMGATQVASISKSLTLQGGYSSDFSSRDAQVNPTILDAQSQGRVLYIDGSSANSGSIDVILDGVELKNGSWSGSEYVAYNDASGLSNSWWQGPAGGGVYARHANLTLTHINLHDNHTPNGLGSGLFMHYGTLSMQSSTVKTNGGTGTGEPLLGDCGGGLFLLQVTATISNSSILNNSAGYGDDVHLASSAYGGGIFLNHSTAAIDHTTIQGNVAATHDSGRGGGLYAEFGSTTLTDSTISGNTAAQVTSYYGQQGGGAYLIPYNSGGTSILTDNVFQNNTVGGIFAYGAMTITGNTFTGNTLASNAGGGGGGANLSGSGTFQNNVLTSNTAVTGGGGVFGGSISLNGNTFQGNTATTGDGGGLVANGTITLTRNTLKGNSAGGCGGGVLSNGLALEDGDSLLNNSALNGGGLCLRANSGGASYQNLVVLNNQASANGSGIYVDRGSASGTVNLRHLTIGGNTAGDGAGVTFKSGSATFTNSILYNQTVGIQTISGSPIFSHTLRYQVTTPTLGTVSDQYATTGDPAFAADGYHLTQTSAAIDAGTTTPVTDDADGETRPQGQAPDLGADESPYTLNMPVGVEASQQAGTPQWVLQWDPIHNAVSWLLQQDYLIQYSYGGAASDPALSSVSIQENLPAALQFSSQETTPVMTFAQNNQLLTWNSINPLAPGSSGWIGVMGQSNDAVSGSTLNSTGKMTFTTNSSQTYTIPLQSNSQVPLKPLLPPALTSPLNGEMCLDENNQLEASGLTYAGMLVHLYENSALVASTTAGASGTFSLKWTSSLTTSNAVNLYATVCDPSNPNACSAPSSSVHLTFPSAFWCPQRSYWEGDVHNTHYVFHFVNDQGRYSTNDFELPGVYGFSGTQLHLYSCCDKETNPFTVKADGITYTTPTSHVGRMWTFTIGAAHDVTVQSQCQVGGANPSHGTVLIDPDGFVFDAKKGALYDSLTGVLAPVKAIAGITVTAYEFVPEWGSWIQWPATLYNNQVNPQVTGSDGYFAFFTPPGKYYLQATGANGYQSWRSPEIVVTSQAVHANIPLTQWSVDPVKQVILTPDGPSPATINVTSGSTVEWVSSPGAASTLSNIASLTENPITRILSSLNPLTSVLGFDGGRLAPGQVYRRQFDKAGTFTYTDGYGKSGQVVVTGKVYLPAIRR